MADTQYSIRAAHLYGDLMNTYGDYGNIIALSYYARQIGVVVTTDLISLGDEFHADDYDFALFGGGQDYEESVVAPDLARIGDEVKKFIENDGPLVAVCGGYQLLGDYFLLADGTRIDGISAMDHYTLNQPHSRFIGNITIKNQETGEEYHGFENHQGRTFLGSDERPLGDVVAGNGNNGEDGSEGVIYKNVYGTYFHGPILTRNGNLALRMLKAALVRKYPAVDWDARLKDVTPEFF
ncbi:glutamine amidotransferase [Periweissella cryptocerci]|uniref:Lipid II isoglutaminyl synthase (glutamine-hydrolyzing) subunit GatD n=1 Tax=Periweissella cryptocerci TaxID=2506420 RepID=A0A4P6YVE3_9LACO|nr:glutamine amidotransferase [Periweissella cryptocerci]QBO36716.1 glutamine amidotransferase [Periweissella cryptocerci]